MSYKEISVKNKVLEGGKHFVTCDWGYYSDGKTWHKGIDLVASATSGKGADYICAYDDGVVTAYQNGMSGNTDETGEKGMGNYVILKHSNGYKTRYMHLLKGSVKVKTGDKVLKGQVIGYMGNTGNSTGRHLHFDISRDEKMPNSYYSNGRYYVDPKPYLAGNSSSKQNGYELGLYEVKSDVNVRKGSGTSFDRILYNNFTSSAKQQINRLYPNFKPDYFPSGLRVTISEVSGEWGRCPTGWVCLKYLAKV